MEENMQVKAIEENDSSGSTTTNEGNPYIEFTNVTANWTKVIYKYLNLLPPELYAVCMEKQKKQQQLHRENIFICH